MGESTDGVPPRIRVTASTDAIVAAFPALADLEPVAWVQGGIDLAPLAGGRDAPGQAARLAALSLPHAEVRGPCPPLPFPAAVGGGVYRRSVGHAPAPAGLPEIVLVPGEGFGLAEHPTTGMCLEMLRLLPAGPALDAGCGSGTLALVWARLGRGVVLAVDLDSRAVSQTERSAVASDLDRMVTTRRGALDALAPDEVHGRVVLANAPRPAQDALLAVPGPPVPRALLMSGLVARDMDEIASTWARRGLRLAARECRGRWQAVVLLSS